MSILTSVVSSILVFSIIVIVHEFGHFYAARKCGVFVEEFAIGMGPKLLSKKIGETYFSLRAVPFGGFCKMLGEDEDGKSDPRAFNSKSLSKRAIIISAGIILNAVLAFLAFFIITLNVGYTTTTVHSVLDGYHAGEAGIKPGDKIIEINGSKIYNYMDIEMAKSEYTSSPIEVSVKRNGEIIKFSVPPVQNKNDGKFYAGFITKPKAGFFSDSTEGNEKAGFLESIGAAANTTVFNVRIVYTILFRLATGRVGFGEMSGPIGITTVIGEQVEKSIAIGVLPMILTVLNLVGSLSINLAVFNLLPIPGLDGGRLVFFIIEAIRRKPMDREREGMIHFAGFVVLIIFAVFIAARDIMKFF